MREYTYDSEEGEFVDFATLDDWRARDEAQRAEIERMRSALKRIINVSDLPRTVERIAFEAVGKFQGEQSQEEPKT